MTGGLISASYLVYTISLLPESTEVVQVAPGLVLAFLAATLLNTLVAALLMEVKYGHIESMSDYGAGTIIGSAVTYLTIISFIFSNS